MQFQCLLHDEILLVARDVLYQQAGFYLENFFTGGSMSMDCIGGPAQSAKILQRVHGEIYFISKCTFEFW